MDELIEELRKAMKDNGLTIAALTEYIDCSWISIQRWLKGKLIPSFISKRRIREGLAKIKAVYPEIEKERPRFQILTVLCMDNLSKMPEKDKDFWELIISKMTANETKAIYWVGMNKEDMKKKILKIAKRLDISQPKETSAGQKTDANI